jgi:hypothetical protein
MVHRPVALFDLDLPKRRYLARSQPTVALENRVKVRTLLKFESSLLLGFRAAKVLFLEFLVLHVGLGGFVAVRFGAVPLHLCRC